MGQNRFLPLLRWPVWASLQVIRSIFSPKIPNFVDVEPLNLTNITMYDGGRMHLAVNKTDTGGLNLLSYEAIACNMVCMLQTT